MTRGRNIRRAKPALRDRAVAIVRSWGEPCHLCELPIDYSIPAGFDESYECDELRPASKGGSVTDPGNMKPAHRACNNWRGNRDMDEVERMREAARSLGWTWSTPQEFARCMKALRAAPRSARRMSEGHSLTTDW